jgi:Xaa-Pro aminopeptidase
MRSDLDALMQSRNFDAFIIPPIELESPQRTYITGVIRANALVIKKRGQDPILIVNHMEAEEAAKSGLPVMTYDAFEIDKINREHGRGTSEAFRALWERILMQLGITGRITLFGVAEAQSLLRLVNILKGLDLELALDGNPSLLDLASETKDAQEIALMRQVGEATCAVLQATWDWLSGHQEQAGQVIDATTGVPLTIGAVKAFVRSQLLAHGLEETKAMIFAQGRDAGIPHSAGEDEQILRTGESIIFDLFPRQLGGGYYHDVTRTWCLSFARPDVQTAYEQVLEVFHRSLTSIALGQPTRDIGRQVCEWFEALGHPTRLHTDGAQEGYIHALGHGLGLEVHESPTISHTSSEKNIFRAGNVLTIEPGLYYPSRGFGVRVEDTVYLDEAGQLHNLTPFRYDLVLPLQGS